MYQPPDMEEGSFFAEFASTLKHPELPVHFLLLQLVMQYLWKEEVDKNHSHCLRLEMLKNLGIPENNISGAQRIVNDHLSKQMKALSDQQQYAMTIVFKYLVSAEGSKIAYPILKLPEPIGINEKELRALLEQLDAKRILRTVKVPSRFYESYYEIFS